MSDDLIRAHNVLQREYFGQRIKKTMLPERTPYVLRQVAEVVRVGGLLPGERVLDVGCGMGRHAFLLAEQGLEVEGLELSPFLVEKLRQFDGGRYRLSVYCADLHQVPEFLHGRYDAVVGFFVLHHLADLARSLQSVAQLLRDGGRAVFLEPNPKNPLFYLQVLVTPGMRWVAEKGMLRMRRSVLEEACQSAGLRLAALSRYGFFPPFLANKPWGQRLERRLESVKAWGAFLPFQLFLAVKDDPVQRP
ncbi:MAG: methyltransferase domain-containing protein [Thermoanaerobaculum sp.]|nr:methyltransferase domain-containing protein [Thermoanaerobaculum sp.]